jgi:hypothetical protein
MKSITHPFLAMLAFTGAAFAEPAPAPSATPTPAAASSAPEATPTPTPEPSSADDIQIKYFAQAQPKPIGLLPPGWDVGVVEDRTVEKTVELPGGKTPKINSKAYVLVPTNKDGLVLDDPGFDVSKGNAQDATVGASLTAYIEAAGDLKKKLDTVTDELRASLAKASPAPVKATKKKTSD